VTDPGLSAGDAARRLGVAVTTLRTWHRRYGLGPESYIPGHHRRYTETDMERLAAMEHLTSMGVPPARAAQLALSRTPADAAGPDAPAGKPSLTPLDDPAGPSARAGGGRAVAVGRARPTARGLAGAAMRLDAGSVREVIDRSLHDNGVVSTWDDVIRPVLVGLGDRGGGTAEYVEVEHLVSRSVSAAFARVPRPAGARPRTLLACADEEQHSLPIEALAAALAEYGVGTTVLGARVPPAALARAVRRTGPAVVLVWSQTAETGRPQQLEPLLAGRPRPPVIAAGGLGWPEHALPADVIRPASLPEAVRLVRDAVQAPHERYLR
jgi:MerR family transcriptional regulator, light-induced transcriptional regulator